MSTTSHLPDMIRRVLLHPSCGVGGLVDDLLQLCREHGLQLDWQADHYRICSFGGDWEELTDVVLPKSVFRAILARLATLCNEGTPNAVSPYGGQGELSVGTNPPAVFKVTFSNSSAEQKLVLVTETERRAIELPENRDGVGKTKARAESDSAPSLF